MSSLSDVAREAGVSVSLVSRVLNESSGLRIRPETRARVLEAAGRLQYVPNHAARSLRLSQSGAIALIVPDIANPFFAELMRGVEAGAGEHGQSVLLGRSEQLRVGGDYLRRLVGEGRVDGFLVQMTDDIPATATVAILGEHLPVVLVNSRGTRRGSVVLDDSAAGNAAAGHLVDLGHRAIGFVGGLPVSYTSRLRRKGFAIALSAAGIRQRSTWTTAQGYCPEDGRQALVEIWARLGPKPTGLVVANVNAATGVLAAARDLRIAVPGDLSVVALHESWISEYTNPTLTTVRMPLYELGVTAARQLKSRLSGKKPEDTMVTDPAPVVIARESTGRPR